MKGFPVNVCAHLHWNLRNSDDNHGYICLLEYSDLVMRWWEIVVCFNTGICMKTGNITEMLQRVLLWTCNQVHHSLADRLKGAIEEFLSNLSNWDRKVYD